MSNDRPRFGRILAGFLCAAVVGVISQFLPMDRMALATLHALLNVLGLFIMLVTAAYGLRRMQGVRPFRWVILGGIAGMTLRETLFQMRNIPYLQELSFRKITIMQLADIAGRTTPAIAAAIGLGFMLALYELERSRAAALRDHRALSEQVVLRKKAEEEQLSLSTRVLELEKSESLIEMAGGVAHELSNLFTVVSGNTGLLLEGGRLPYAEQTNLKAIERAAAKGAELAAKMRAYAGASRTRQIPVNLSDIVAEMNDALRTGMPPKIEFRMELADDLPNALLDEVGVRQAISSLVTNAIEAIGSEPGRIVTATGTKSIPAHYHEAEPLHGLIATQYVYVEVKDTGCGMDVATERRALDPFFSTKFLGRGLGLAIVQGVARSHEGYIEIESAPGAGSVFRLLIPRCTDEDRHLLLGIQQDEPAANSA